MAEALFYQTSGHTLATMVSYCHWSTISSSFRLLTSYRSVLHPGPVVPSVAFKGSTGLLMASKKM